MPPSKRLIDLTVGWQISINLSSVEAYEIVQKQVIKNLGDRYTKAKQMGEPLTILCSFFYDNTFEKSAQN